jgi:hypothetical protein
MPELLGRLDYPDQHIEADNRLTFMLGALAKRFPDARYIHLSRDVRLVGESYAARYDQRHGAAQRSKRVARTVVQGHWGATPLAEAWVHGLHGRSATVPTPERQAVFTAMAQTMTDNIEVFLEGRPHRTMDISEGAGHIGELWDWLGVEGDLAAAQAEFATRHNARP